MKKFLTGFISGAIVFGSIGAFAATSEIKLIINGEIVKSDVPPQVINGRTLIPARTFAEALGARVEWDSENRAVIVTTDDNPIRDVRHDGNDDGPLHDLNDDYPNSDVTHDRNDDGVDHDLHDDSGEHQVRDRNGRDH